MASHIRVGLIMPPQGFSISNGCQDHTTSPYASMPLVLRADHQLTRLGKPALRYQLHARHRRVRRISPRVRDDRDTPLVWDETVWLIAMAAISENQNIFCYGLDRADHTRSSPSGTIFLVRHRRQSRRPGKSWEKLDTSGKSPGAVSSSRPWRAREVTSLGYGPWAVRTLS
jgi:hypothetical protein